MLVGVVAWLLAQWSLLEMIHRYERALRRIMSEERLTEMQMRRVALLAYTERRFPSSLFFSIESMFYDTEDWIRSRIYGAARWVVLVFWRV
jgi:hypothetical protein